MERRRRVVRTPFAAHPRRANDYVFSLFGVPIKDENPFDGGDRLPPLHHSNSHSIENSIPGIVCAFESGCPIGHLDILPFLQNLNTRTLTDSEAEAIVDPYSVCNYPLKDILEALLKRLRESAADVEWNKPKDRLRWKEELRFLGEWWLTLRNPADKAVLHRRSLMGASNADVHPPLIHPDHHCPWEEDQLLADLAWRMQGNIYHLDLLHLDEFTLSPDRMHVLMIDGVMKLKQLLDSESMDTSRASRCDRYVPSGAAAFQGRQSPCEPIHTVSEPSHSHVQWRTQWVPATGDRQLPRSPCHLQSSGIVASTITAEDDNGHPLGAAGEACLRVSEKDISLSRIVARTPPANSARASLTRSDKQNLSRRLSSAGPMASDTRTAYEPRPSPYARGTSLLETLSFSICSISTASLLLILAPLTADRSPYTRNLDLSYNLLTSRCFYTLAVLIPLTQIRRLSLRGNDLSDSNFTPFRDFLLEGCQRIEELDLSYTNLTVAQVCLLIEVLPSMRRLYVLLLDGVEIPIEKTSALTRAIYKSRLCHISLQGSLTCASAAYVRCIENTCEKRKEHLTTGNTSVSTQSFFDALFLKSLKRGLQPPMPHGLVEGYRPFTNNDPSLFDEELQQRTEGKIGTSNLQEIVLLEP